MIVGLVLVAAHPRCWWSSQIGWQVAGQHVYLGFPAEEWGGICIWGSLPLSGEDEEYILGLITVGLKKVFLPVWPIGLRLVCSPWVSVCACSSPLKHTWPSVRSALLEKRPRSRRNGKPGRDWFVHMMSASCLALRFVRKILPDKWKQD